MTIRERVSLILLDIRFWISAFFILHLTSITLPPLEPGSTWRQTDGYMVARNFFEIDSNIFYPRVDVAGNKSGIVGCEFPILNYLVYLLSVVFGYHSWFGRLINLIVSSTGVYFLYRLIKEHFNRRAALNTSIIVLSSIWFIYNRTNVPDTFGASLCIVSLYYGVKYLREPRWSYLILFLIAGLIGCLSRISAAVVLTVIAIPFLFGKTGDLARAMTSVVALLIFSGVYAWYFMWVPQLNEAFGLSGHFYMGSGIADGLRWLASDPGLTLKRFYETPMKYIAFVVFVCSLFYAFKSRNWPVVWIFAIPFVAYSIIVLNVATGFHIDAYYTIMYMLPMAFVAGWGLSQLNNKILMNVIVLAIFIEGVANQVHVFTIREPYKSLEGLEMVMDSVSQRNNLIAINGIFREDPTPMYMAHRRGWVYPNDTLADPAFQRTIKSEGCVYIVIAKKVYGDVGLSLPKVYDSEFFAVYKL